ncbi:MAG: hypothetical protein AB7T27_06385 [Kiritimatiellia bacterium]
MNLTEEELKLISKREQLVKIWPVAAILSVVLLTGLAAWMLMAQPLLINPLAVMDGLKSGTISETTLALMAGLLPFSVSMCLLICVVMLLVASAAMAREKKYITALRRLTGGPS